MVTYRYLGSANTDANGIAKYNFTGSGAGEIDYIASLDNPIVDGSIVSQPYTVYDTIFKDMGTSTDYGNWSNWTGYEPKLERTDYCTVKVDTENSKTSARMYKQIDTSNNTICMEFDIKVNTSLASERFATLRNNTASVLGSLEMERFGATTNNWHHFKIEITPTNAKVYLDNSSNPYTYSSSGITRFYIDIDTDVTELDYKNFVIYPV